MAYSDQASSLIGCLVPTIISFSDTVCVSVIGQDEYLISVDIQYLYLSLFLILTQTLVHSDKPSSVIVIVQDDGYPCLWKET